MIFSYFVRWQISKHRGCVVTTWFSFMFFPDTLGILFAHPSGVDYLTSQTFENIPSDMSIDRAVSLLSSLHFILLLFFFFCEFINYKFLMFTKRFFFSSYFNTIITPTPKSSLPITDRCLIISETFLFVYSIIVVSSSLSSAFQSSVLSSLLSFCSRSQRSAVVAKSLLLFNYRVLCYQ